MLHTRFLNQAVHRVSSSHILVRSFLLTTASACLASSSTASTPSISASMHTDGGTDTSPTLVIEPNGEHKNTIIFMHGLGDTAYGWHPVFAMYSRIPAFHNTRMVLPTAPEQPVSLNNGMRMPSWYDITLGPRAAMECDGIEDSRRRIEELISWETEKTGIDRSHMILGGFSQGAALTFYTGLQSETPFLGMLCLSGYLPLFAHLENYTRNFNTPILQCHGDRDPMVEPEFGQKSGQLVKDLGIDLTFHMIPGLDHGFNEEEDHIVRKWLIERLESDNNANSTDVKSDL